MSASASTSAASARRRRRDLFPIASAGAQRSRRLNDGRHDRCAPRPLERACMSLMLDLGESIGNHRGNRRLCLETAPAASPRSGVALRFGAISGHIDESLARELDRDLDRVMAMLWQMRQRGG